MKKKLSVNNFDNRVGTYIRQILTVGVINNKPINNRIGRMTRNTHTTKNVKHKRNRNAVIDNPAASTGQKVPNNIRHDH